MDHDRASEYLSNDSSTLVRKSNHDIRERAACLSSYLQRSMSVENTNALSCGIAATCIRNSLVMSLGSPRSPSPSKSRADSS